uniref:sn-1-specific diacylglycerol lipase n=1 Tax=Rodentolepis nana TaxID=102285 RepID=A0A0R3T2M8_RODNA
LLLFLEFFISNRPNKVNLVVFKIGILKYFNFKYYRNPKAPDRQVDLENGITGPGGCLCAGRNCYLAAFLEMSQLETGHILVFQITDKFYDAALMMVIDDITEAIVVVVRGTLSGTDTLIDLVAAGEPLRDEDYSLPNDQKLIAHSGMVRTSRNIANKIIEDKWIESAKALRPKYPLVITGHSLGGGLVSLMCVFLKPHFPEIKAYAFSPPGGLMNKNLAEFTRDYLCSITYGYDLIGHLDSQTMEDLRARIFHALCVYRTPKFRALTNQMCLTITRNLVCKSKLPQVIRLDAVTGSKLIDPDMNDAYETPIGSKFKPHLKDRVVGSTKVDRLYVSDRSLMRWKKPDCHSLLVLPRPYPKSLYPECLLEPKKHNLYTLDLLMESMLRPIPSGRLLHIIEVDKEFEVEGEQSYKKPGYQPPPIAIWSNAETFNSILIHPKMIFNHSPIYVSTALNRLYDSIMHPRKIFCKIHLNTYYKEAKSVPGIERKYADHCIDNYCRVRKLK